MSCTPDARSIVWELNEPFQIARGVLTHIAGMVVTLSDGGGHQGRAEAYGIHYEGETTASMLNQIEEVQSRFRWPQPGVDGISGRSECRS